MLAIYAAFLQLPYTTSDAAITRTFPKPELGVELELGVEVELGLGRSSAPRRGSRDDRDSRLNGLNDHVSGDRNGHPNGHRAIRRCNALCSRRACMSWSF